MAQSASTPPVGPTGPAGSGTGSILLAPGGAVLPDGSANNLAPALLRLQGTQTGAKAHYLCLAFDGGGNLEGCWWTFRMPANYSSGGQLRLSWVSSAITGNVKWQCQIGAISPGDADTPIEHALAAAAFVTTAANATEAGRYNDSLITLTMDSAAAGDFIELFLFRDSNDAADTNTVDAQLLFANFEYVSA